MKVPALLLGALLVQACAVTGVGVEGTVGVDYDADYYAGPCCYDYGWWGRGYHVAPGHGGERRREPERSHSFRSPSPSRPTPSLPGRPRR